MRPWLWMDVVFTLAFAGYVFRHPVWSGRYVIGLAVTATGLFLWILARLQLGRSFSVRAKATALVTTGLYSKIRHPVYLFGSVAITGIFITFGHWLGYCVFLLVQTVQLARIRKEEAVLERTFGETYRTYKTQTWF